MVHLTHVVLQKFRLKIDRYCYYFYIKNKGTMGRRRKVVNRETGVVTYEHLPLALNLGIRISNFTPRRLNRSILKYITQECHKKFNNPKHGPKEIKKFIKTYGKDIQLSDFVVPKGGYRTMNDFFIRAIKPGKRPIANPRSQKIMVSPADCRMSTFSKLNKAKKLWIKGTEFSVTSLLQCDKKTANRYQNGAVCIARLAPQDYHRYHFPIQGDIMAINRIEGDFMSVNPLTVHDKQSNVYTRNKRDIMYLKTKYFGVVAIAVIGATCVGSIELYRESGRVKKGELFGNFQYGGSTLVILIPKGKIRFDEDLIETSLARQETYIKMGQKIGVASMTISTS